MTAQALVADLERRLSQPGLPHVRAWKSADAGRRAIGILPVLAPREIVWAAGALPVFVRGGGDRVDTVRGDAFYQSYICRLPRSTIELGVSGELDVLDGMLFPNTCDVIRNLSGMWRDLLPGHYVRLVDPPQTAAAEAALRFWRHDLATLLSELCALAGREPDLENVRGAITEYAAARLATQRLLHARVAEPWNHPVDETYLVRRAGDSMPPLEYQELVSQYLTLARARRARREDRIRVLLVGSFCEQPPLGLLRALERSGCYVVDDDLVSADIDADAATLAAAIREADPLTALARASLSPARPASVRFDAAGEHGRKLAARARSLGADGVVFAAPSFCDPALLDQPRLQAALDRARVPHTTLKYAENTGQFQVFREQAGTFADSVKLWGQA